MPTSLLWTPNEVTTPRMVSGKRATVRQPRGGTRVDWSNPLTRGLVFFFNPADSTDAVSGAVAAPGGSALKWSKSSDRLGGHIAVSSNRGSQATGNYMIDTGSRYPIGTGDFTMAAGLKAGESTWGQAVTQIGSAASKARLTISEKSIVTGGAGPYQIGIDDTTTTQVIVGQRNATGLQGWRDGIKTLTDAAKGTIDIGNVGQVYILNTGTNLRASEVSFFAVWNRALSDAEVKEFSCNPWALLAASPLPTFYTERRPAVSMVPTRRVWTRQPSFPTPLPDVTHPLLRKGHLQHFYAPTNYTTAARDFAANANLNFGYHSPTIKQTPHGAGVQLSGNVAYINNWPSNDPTPGNSGVATHFVLVVVTGSFAGGGGGIYSNNYAGGGLSFKPSATGKWVCGTSPSAVEDTEVVSTGKLYVLVGTVPASGNPQFWVNGRFVGTASQYSDWRWNHYIQAGPGSGANTDFVVLMKGFIGGYAWNDGEVAEFTSNPWALLGDYVAPSYYPTPSTTKRKLYIPSRGAVRQPNG